MEDCIAMILLTQQIQEPIISSYSFTEMYDELLILESSEAVQTAVGKHRFISDKTHVRRLHRVS